MKNGQCPKCQSGEVYLSRRGLEGDQFALLVRAGEYFEIECYICLDCRQLELYAVDTSVGLFGKGKNIRDLVSNDKSWERASGRNEEPARGHQEHT
jgi:predicted nucleic-acid-binding Zn-ribbon protein